MLDKVLDSCRYVVDNSTYVNINYKKLDLFIKNVNFNEFKNWLTNNPYNLYELGISNIVNLLLIFESIDYSFWGTTKWTIQTDLGEKDGSDALLYLMIKYIKENKNSNFSNISLSEFKNIMKGNTEISLLEERYKTVVEISKIVNEKMNGNFYEYIKNINEDKELFEIIVNNFPSFKDERTYNGNKIYFYKLAQLLTSDILHLREELERLKVDYSNLVGCADYKIPQTMRALGIIEYNEELSKIIDNKKEIDISSKYEVEIRANMLFVINYIKERINNVAAIDVNDYFFTQSKNVKKYAKPYHLCRNTNY